MEYIYIWENIWENLWNIYGKIISMVYDFLIHEEMVNINGKYGRYMGKSMGYIIIFGKIS